MKLYTYFRSSAAYRVRIALNLKGLAFETDADPSAQGRRARIQAGIPRDQSADAGAGSQARSSGDLLTQSLAIIEYLDEIHPQPPLLPKDPIERANVRALAQLIACDIHPLNNSAPLAI